MNWMNLTRKMEELAHDVRCAIHGVAPDEAKRERSSSSVVAESAALLRADAPADQGQPAYRQPQSCRAERIRSHWATTVIEPIMLRDGRLQEFSHVTRRSSDRPQNTNAEKPKLTLHIQNILAHAVAHSSAMRAALALMVAGDFAQAQNAVADSLPQYARKAAYGSGWECVSGYRRTDSGCTLGLRARFQSGNQHLRGHPAPGEFTSGLLG